MASKRLMLDVEEEEEGEEGACGNDAQNANVEKSQAKRRKSLHAHPLQRMLKQHLPASAAILSPITELAQNMSGARLDGTPKSTQRSQSSTRPLSTFNSLSSRTLSGFSSSCSSYDSGNSLDDEYMAMFELESTEDHNLELPDDLEKLLNGQLKSEGNPEKETATQKRTLRRCMSLFPTDQPEDDEPAGQETNPSIKKLQKRTLSMNDAEIMSALGEEPQLIGDLSKPCALPCLITGVRHRDLKTISSDTLARLIQGEFDLGSQGGYQIIDCRYPYEFLGGHIKGARNLYTRGQIQEFFPSLKSNQEDRRIYVFHCEFSSERGPKLLRFLRSNDRSQHAHNYPTLDYPELYILHNGYKEFFGLYAQLCEPSQYVPMLAPAHNDEFRYFRAKTKSWQCGEGGDSGIGGGGSRDLRKSRSRLLYAE
ncbi:cdc25-like protein phosphatase twine [Drosophila elegans]|uniref:cdc25-like protein phosphatase twine n=1 Tax=Drosophila elegans TaxID=30023 RepID=UPI0007E85CE1|nr:cdc25-like protein phosphatase twine [Drosophila elegans]